MRRLNWRLLGIVVLIIVFVAVIVAVIIAVIIAFEELKRRRQLLGGNFVVVMNGFIGDEIDALHWALNDFIGGLDSANFLFGVVGLLKRSEFGDGNSRSKNRGRSAKRIDHVVALWVLRQLNVGTRTIYIEDRGIVDKGMATRSNRGGLHALILIVVVIIVIVIVIMQAPPHSPRPEVAGVVLRVKFLVFRI